MDAMIGKGGALHEKRSADKGAGIRLAPCENPLAVAA
jgi:hypothetical protein